jgi:hypothetical protein
VILLIGADIGAPQIIGFYINESALLGGRNGRK